MTIQTSSWQKINSILDGLINELSRAKDKNINTSRKIQNLASQVIFECQHFTEDPSEFVSWDELSFEEDALQSKITAIERILEKGSIEIQPLPEALAEVGKIKHIRTERFINAREKSMADLDHAMLGQGICYGYSLSVAAQSFPKSNLPQARFVHAAYKINNSMLCRGNAQKIGSAIFENPQKYLWILSHAAHMLNYRELSDLLKAYENPQEKLSLSTLIGRAALELPFTLQSHNWEEASVLSAHMADIEQRLKKTPDAAKLKSDLADCKKQQAILKNEENEISSAFAQLKELYSNNTDLHTPGLPDFIFRYLKISPGKKVIASSPASTLESRLKDLPDKKDRFILHLRSNQASKSGYRNCHAIFFSFDPPAFSDPNNLHPVTSIPIVEEFSSSDEMLSSMCNYLNSHYFQSGEYLTFSVDRHENTL